MMNVRFFDPGKWYKNHYPEMLNQIDRVLLAGDLILREDLEKFEHSLAKMLGKKHAIGVNSGTDALYLSLWALGIGEGDEVIVPGHTFVASAQVVAQLGATPVLVDVGDDLLMEKNITFTEKTRAIIPVHLTGDVVRFSPEFIQICADKKIHIVEDAAQALGAKGVGYGKTQCYSFYPAKILGAYGDAGAITTDDDVLADELRQLRHHYKRDYSKWGINSRLDNVQAAVLNVKMEHIEESLKRREQIALMYRTGLQSTPIKLPEYSEGRVWQDYVIRFKDNVERENMYTFLKEQGIETMRNDYPFPIEKPENALRIESQTLRIPCNDVLDNAEVTYIIKKIIEFYV